MSRKKVTLLLTCVGGATVPALLQELWRQSQFDVRVIGVDNTADCLAAQLVDQFHHVPMGADPNYLPAMLDIARREKVDAILPGSDEEAFALSGHLEEFRQMGVVVIASSRSCLEMITSKLLVYRALEAANLPVPEYSVATTGAEILDCLGKYGFPERSVIVKPATGRGGRGLHVFCGHDSPPDWLGNGLREKRLVGVTPTEESLHPIVSGEMLVMPRMHAPVYDADVLASKGIVKAIVVRRRTNPTGIPFEGNRIIVEENAVSYCKRIAEVVGLDALHDMDLMTNDEGELRLLEVNPRPSGSLVASLAAGVALIDAAIGLTIGEDVQVSYPQTDVEISTFVGAVAVAKAPGR